MNELDLFCAVIGIADPSERTTFLDRHCADKPELRQRLAQLLDAHFNSNQLLDPTNLNPLREQLAPVNATSDFFANNERAGTVIAGKYTLVELVGEGGMGSVWRAKQSEPVKRFVAVKLIKAGMDSKQVLARFNAERQALALMDHPNISKVLDGGLHEQRPFFVMELVKGVPITEYCDKCKLTPKQRLELFVPVCQAIQHAHQKGIIHRDIKPSNVLIALYDDKAVVKVIDFGVAKATGGALTDASIDTAMGAVVGTPQYMSPEQATLNNLDIDTRSDVYALGVLLYELLTGSPPFSKRDLEKRGLLEMLRVVREEEPQRPSTKLSTADALPTLSANRGTESKKLTGLLRNELDWIVMKALEKDRTRRYETANGFAADVLRYLGGEAVQAHPPSTAYRMQKFVRRNKGQVIAASLVLFALLAGIAGTSYGLIRAEWSADAERIAKLAALADRESAVKSAELERVAKLEAEQQQALSENSAEAERQAKLEAESQKRTAEEERAIAVSVKTFLQTRLLGQADVTNQANALLQAGGLAANVQENPTIRELLDRASEELSEAKIEANFPNQPLLQAEILQTVGITYTGVGEAEKAIRFLERSVDLFKARQGSNHPNTVATMINLARSYLAAGKQDLALPLFEETLKLSKSKLGTEHPNTVATMGNLARSYLAAGKQDLAISLFKETLQLSKSKLGTEHPHTLASMNNLASGYQAAGKLDQALPLFMETLKLTKAKLGTEHPHTLMSMNNLAKGYLGAGKLDLALPLFEETLKLTKAKLGAEHPHTLVSMSDLASGYQAAGKLDLALPLYEETLKLFKSKLGAEHPHTLTSMSNLASGYEAAGKPDQALPLFEETLKLSKAKLGAEHPDTLRSMNNLAFGYQSTGKLDLALPLYEETLTLTKAKLGADHPLTLTSMLNLASGYQATGKLDLAIPLFEETLKLSKSKLGAQHPQTLVSMSNLAFGYQAAGKLDLALPLYEETLSLMKAKLGTEHPYTLNCMKNLATCYQAAGKLDQAVALFTEVGQRFPKNSPQFAETLMTRGLSLLETNAFAEAEPLLRECLAIREQRVPDDWRTFNTQSMLGGALLGQQKYADAEPLLLKGYEGLKQRETSIPSQRAMLLPEALDRLIQLYTATDKPDETKKWQAERATYPPSKEVAPPQQENQ